MLGILNFSARNSKRGNSSCVSLASLGAVELLFYWEILDVFWGYGVFLRKFYLGILNSALEILEFLNSRCPLGFAAANKS